MSVLFSSEESSLLLRLVAAHLLTDFYLQKKQWVIGKMQKNLASPYLWLHAAIAGALAWLFLWSVELWWVFAITFITHLLIDAGKIKATQRMASNTNLSLREKARKELRWFVADQFLHVIVLLVLWLAVIHGYARFEKAVTTFLPGDRFLLYLTGYLVILQPTGFLIGHITRRWLPELNMNDSLQDAGTWIGMLERTIVLTLIFSQQFSAIGFLIAAKSILRVTDKPERDATDSSTPFSSRKHTEYVLIGTFISFGCALLIGLLIDILVKAH